MTSPIKRSQALVLSPVPDPAERTRRKRRKANPIERGSDLLNRTVLGLVIVAALALGVGGWSATAELSGAVIAPGQLVVDSHVKRVQHPTGGVVGEIRVRNGDRVAAGQVLLVIDDGQSRAVAAIQASKIVQLESERSRLVAERNGDGAMTFPAALDAADERARRSFDEERRLLDARRSGWQSQKARLNERIAQTRNEVGAIAAQRAAKDKEIELIRQELRLVDDLHKRQLANVVRLIGMKRELARFEGERGALEAQIARAESSINEIELQIVELDQRILADVQSKMRDIDGQLAELSERKAAADEQVRRTEVRAPVSGVVHELTQHTVGGVLRPGETIMTLVPEREALSAEVRIAPRDIDQVSVGQRAILRFSALSQEETPEFVGRVIHVGADLSRDQTTGREYFVARIEVDAAAARGGAGLKLSPGMPLDGFIETGQRTALSYLLKPITDQLAKAMREN